MIRWLIATFWITTPIVAEEAVFLSSLTWSFKNDAFGGFSSLHLDEHGEKILATSDIGYFYTATVHRDREKIIQITDQMLIPLQTPTGGSVSKSTGDSEGIAVSSNGTIYVSFERQHRVWQFSKPGVRAKPLSKHADFKTLQNNSSLEALAVDARGWLYTIPERSGALDRPFPVYRFNGKAWDKRLTLPRRGLFLVTGADFGPDGKFYLLERHYQAPFGVRTRIRRFTSNYDRFSDEEVLLETQYGTHDNLEGISVWKDQKNRIRITLISDDNFNAIQRTELVEYVVR